MAVGAKPSSAPPSLQRLLSLDKSFDSPDQRIQEAARILGLPSPARTERGRTLSTQRRHGVLDSAHTARHEFVVRWLLHNLKTQPAVRQNPLAWSLLYSTLDLLPSPLVSKAVSGTGFLALVSQAFSHLFPTTSGEVVVVASHPSEHVPEDASSKKRKRSKAEREEAVEQPVPAPEEADCRHIFNSVAAILRLLLDRADRPESGSLHAPVHNQIRSVLALDNQVFATLMKHWLVALALFTPAKEPTTESGQPAELAFGLKVITDLLSFQPTLQSSDVATSFDFLFCRECTAPAAFLLSRLYSPFSLWSSPPQSSAVATSIQELERLLAQQLFAPARAAFRASSEDTAPSTKRSSRRIQPGLSERLEPFRAYIISLADDSGRNRENDAKLLALQHALPYLLDVALRCTPTASPRQRIAEGPWVDALFSALCNALPRSASLLDDDQISTPNMVLADMLDVVLRKKLSLATDLLIKLVNDWSDLLRWGNDALPNAGQPDFRLLSKALAMDSSIFTDTQSTRARALFQALTIHGQVTEDNRDKISSTQELLCKSIAVPLMKAYARIRNLGGFITQWLSQLQKDSSWQNQSWSIWIDQYLQASLRDVLEASLTVPQIIDILEPCRLSLVDLTTQCASGKKVASSVLSLAAASAVIMNAVVGAVHSDTATDALQALLQSIIDTEQALLQIIGSTELGLMTTLMALLARAYLLWLPVWSSTHSQEEAKTMLGTAVDSPAVEQSLSLIKGLKSTKSGSSASSAQQAAADAAFAFIATLCDLARHSQTHGAIVKSLLEKAVLLYSMEDSSSAITVRWSPALYIVLTNYPGLLEHVPKESRKAIFTGMFHLTREKSTLGQVTAEAFVDAIVSVSTHAIQDELFAAVAGHLDSNSSSETDRSVAGALLLQWSSKGLSRQQRETVLDLTLDAILQRGDETPDLRPRLGLMANLLEMPSATAKVALDSSIVWQLASAISAEEQDALTLDLFEEICRLIFDQIVDNKEQKRSAAFLASISDSAAALMEAKQPLRSCAGQLRLLAAFVKVTEGRLDDETLSALPHKSSSTTDSLIKQLYQTLSSSLEDDQGVSSTLDRESTAIAVRLYNSLPASFLNSGGSSSKKYTKRFTKLLDSLLSLSGLRTITAARADTLVPLSVQVQSYQQLAPTIIGEDASQLCGTAGRLLLQGLDAKQHHAVLNTFSDSLLLISDAEKLSLVNYLLNPVSESLAVTAEKVGLVRCIIMSLQSPKDPDEAFSVGVLTSLLSLLRGCTDFDTHCELVDCVVAILRNKPTLVTQYGVEITVATLIHLTTPESPSLETKKSQSIFEGLCDMTRSLLQFHRPSLGGRYHVFIPLLERLVACLFTPASRDNAATGRFKHPVWIDNKQHPLNASHAQRVSRLLENLCNPPQSDISKRRQRQTAGHDLVDMTRKSRIQVGQHVQHILHYLCTLLLNGRLGDGMRDALTPGLWAVMDVTEMGADDTRGVKALSASMNNAERAILRGVFEDWRRFGSWSG